MRGNDRLYIVIPAYNESQNIHKVVDEWAAVIKEIGSKSRLVVIDDGSKDDTLEVLNHLKLKYSQLNVMTKQNSGHGSTILYGYKWALDNGADFVFQTDSDGQTVSEEFWEMWTHRRDYDFQCGWRHDRQDGIDRKFVTLVLKLVVLIQFRILVKDSNAPFRLINKSALQYALLKIPENYNLANVIMSVVCKKNPKFKTRWIRITFKPRQGGVNSINLPKIFKIGQKAILDFSKIIKRI